MRRWLRKVRSNPKTVIFAGIIIMLCSLSIANNFTPVMVKAEMPRKTLKERFPFEADFVKELLDKSALSEEGFISNGTELFPVGEIPIIEIFGASGKYYKIIGQFNESPATKYCTREQAIDMILGNMLWRHFIFNHDDYVFVKNMFDRCFDSQIETMFLGEFMTECKIVEEEFANDIENTLLPLEEIFGFTLEDIQTKKGEKYYLVVKEEYEERHKKMQENWQWAKEHIIDGENK